MGIFILRDGMVVEGVGTIDERDEEMEARTNVIGSGGSCGN